MRAGRRPPGAVALEGRRTRFRVWAPEAERVELVLEAPRAARAALEPVGEGWFELVADAGPGARYRYALDGGEPLPDPASALQPEGVRGPSEVVGDDFPWSDAGWSAPPLRRAVLYELHVGTFAEDGTFDGVARRLDELAELGVTLVQLLPVAAFPGERNWGYDGVFPWAVQASYGGPDGLRRLVDACHARGLGLSLDVVYNHLGPEGNVLAAYGPYFTERYRTPWGDALNFDGPDSDEVRAFFVESAVRFVRDFHVDALRLDAVHAIADTSARPFLQELTEAVHAEADRQGRRVHVIAESDLNDPRLIRSPELGGFGMDAQWCDDFHHALHALATGERDGYYRDFGAVEDLARAWRDGYVYAGRRSAFRRRRHGAPPTDVSDDRFLVYAQTHDQVGNRAAGERLTALVDRDRLRLAAAAYLLSPYVPMLFMGEERAEEAPFLYFVHHSDPELVEAVRRGRREEFAAFRWEGDVPDPQAPETFERSRTRPLEPAEAAGDPGRMRAWYRELLRLRREIPAVTADDRGRRDVVALEGERCLLARRTHEDGDALVALNFGDAPCDLARLLPRGAWRVAADSADPRWGGAGSELPERAEAGSPEPVRLAAASAALLVEDVAAR